MRGFPKTKKEVTAMVFKQIIYYPDSTQEIAVPARPEEWRVIGSATTVRYLGGTPLSEEFIEYARLYGWSYCHENRSFYPCESSVD